MTDAGSRRLVGNRYRLDSVAGSGGSGTVWRGFDLRLEREVAVKELGWSAGEDDQSRKRALREARTAARLPAPGVIRVFDVIEEPERVYLIMEFIAAPSLAAFVRDGGPLSASHAADIALSILDTLDVAHEANIVHRDVKPHNVLVGSRQVWLADFGIVHVAGDPQLTATGIVLGTPAFIAPEQARGTNIGPWTDLYGLGATLYFSREGEAPFRGDATLSTVLSVLHDVPRPMITKDPMARLIQDLLDKEPAHRPTLAEARTVLLDIAESSRDADVATAPSAATVLPPLGSDESIDEWPESVVQWPVDEVVMDGSAVADSDEENLGAMASPSRRRIPILLTVAALLVAVAAMILGRGVDGSTEIAIGVTPSIEPDVVPTELQVGAVTDTNAPITTGEPTPAAPEPPTPGTASTEPALEAAPPATAAGEGPDDVGQPDVADEADEADEAEASSQALGWARYAPDDAPYSLTHPEGWQIVSLGNGRTDIVEPDTGVFLRVEWSTATASPVQWFQGLATDLDRRRDTYEQYQLREATFGDDQAALWEYAYAGPSGMTRRAYNLGINHRGQYTIAVNLQVPDSRWDEAQPVWEEIVNSLELRGLAA